MSGCVTTPTTWCDEDSRPSSVGTAKVGVPNKVGRNKVGRAPTSDIVVDDTGISRQHVKFEVTEFGTILTDLNSTNGTFVEDQRVKEVTLLDGNAVTIGRTTIMYWDGLPSEGDV